MKTLLQAMEEAMAASRGSANSDQEHTLAKTAVRLKNSKILIWKHVEMSTEFFK